MTYGGKPIASLTDAVLLIAEKDCADQVAKYQASPSAEKLATRIAAVQAIGEAVAAEKAKRGLS